MKCIILASGKGTRLLPFTNDIPKMLIDLNGKTLLEENLKNIENSGTIKEVIIIVGYLGNKIEDKLKDYKGRLKIKVIYNPLYEVSNNLITLLLAKEEMNSDFLITNGDNLFKPEVYRELAKNEDGIFITIKKKEKYFDDDMKVIINENTITKISKKIENNSADAESAGLVLISGIKAIEDFKSSLMELTKTKECLDYYWLEIFNNLIEKNREIFYYEIIGEKWFELDYHGDLAKLLGRGFNEEK